MDTATLLRGELTASGLDAVALAARTSLSLATVHRYLDGTVEPSAARLMTLLRALGVTTVPTGLQTDPVWQAAALEVARRGEAAPAQLRDRLTRARYLSTVR